MNANATWPRTRLPKGAFVQLNNDHRIPLSQGTIVIEAGAVGEIETPGISWCRVRFKDTISALIPERLLNPIAQPE